MIWGKILSEKIDTYGNTVKIDNKGKIVTIKNILFDEKHYFEIIKYDENGKIIWQKNFEDEKQNMAYSLTVDAENNIIIIGFIGVYTLDPLPDSFLYILKLDENGKILWDKKYKKGLFTIGNGITVDHDDNIITCSSFLEAGKPHFTCLTVKFDKNGEKIWEQIFHENYIDYPYAITTDEMDNVIVVGYSFTPYRINGKLTAGFLSLKYDKNGKFLWYNRYEEREVAESFNVLTDKKNNIYILGNNHGNLVLIKSDETGKIINRNMMKTKTNDIPYGFAFTSNEELIIGMTSHSKRKKFLSIINYDKDNNFNILKKPQKNFCLFDLTVDSNDNMIYTGTKIGEFDNYFLFKEKI